LQTVRLGRELLDVYCLLRTFHYESIKALAAHYFERLDASVRDHNIVSPLVHHVDVLAGARFRIEIENVRMIAP
jgi:hypothetical protein